MNFFYSVINLVGFLFYIAAGFAAIRALCTYDYFFNKKEWKSTSFVLSILILSPILGYCIRDFAQHQKELLQFKEIVKQESSKSETNNLSLMRICGSFSDLSEKDKEEQIQIVFEKFYDSSLNGKCAFLNQYNDENLEFVLKIKKEVKRELASIYNIYDKSADINSWSNFQSVVTLKNFLEHAPQETIDKEFSKWDTDDSAWNRVILLDSIYLSNVYLSRFPRGLHEYEARRIILNDDFDPKYDSYRITSNFDGTTTIEVINRSSYPAELNYDGTFAKGYVSISGNSRKSISIPNGYYRISITSQKLHTRGIHERVVCNGGYIPYDLELQRDYRTH